MTTNTTTTALPLAPGTWAVDHNHSSIGFTIRHLGISKVRGRFTHFDASVVIGSSLADTAVTATIDLASIDTGNAERDAHVRTAEYLDVARRPTLTFRSQRIVADEGTYRLQGEVSFGDLTRPLELVVEHGGIGEFPGGPRHAGFEATGELRRSELGIAPHVPAAALGDVIRFQLDIQLLEPTA